MNLKNESKIILIVTCQGLPQPDRPATGAGLRAYGLGEALKKRGHQVIYSVPEACLDGSRDSFEDWIRYSHNVTDIKDIVTQVSPDVVIFSNWGLACEAAECEVPAVVDINGSLVLENHYRKRGTLLDDTVAKIRALSKVDLVLAGSETQKTYLTAWCLVAGMDPDTLSIEVVPLSLPPHMPKPQPPEEPIFVMAGYDWPWLDGQSAIEVVSRELERLKRGHLNIYASPPLYTDVLPGEDSSLDPTGSLEVGHLPHVTLHEPVSFDKLVGILSQSSVALDAWGRNLERELAFPTRTVVYLWAGLPVIESAYGELSELIKRYGAGWTVDPCDAPYLADLVRNIVTDPGRLAGPRSNVQRLVTSHLIWDNTIEPLDRFCRSPHINRRPSPLISTLDRFERDQQTLQHELEETHQTIRKQEERISDSRAECELMGLIHRRPKGFAVLTSPSLAWRRLRRLVFGLPVLAYLFTLTSIGHFLYTLSMWRRRP